MQIIRLFRAPVRFIILRSCCIVHDTWYLMLNDRAKDTKRESIYSKYCSNVISPSQFAQSRGQKLLIRKETVSRQGLIIGEFGHDLPFAFNGRKSLVFLKRTRRLLWLMHVFEIYTLGQIRIIRKNFIISWTWILYHTWITSRAWSHNNSFVRYVHQEDARGQNLLLPDYAITAHNFSSRNCCTWKICLV